MILTCIPTALRPCHSRDPSVQTAKSRGTWSGCSRAIGIAKPHAFAQGVRVGASHEFANRPSSSSRSRGWRFTFRRTYHDRCCSWERPLSRTHHVQGGHHARAHVRRAVQDCERIHTSMLASHGRRPAHPGPQFLGACSQVGARRPGAGHRHHAGPSRATRNARTTSARSTCSAASRPPDM